MCKAVERGRVKTRLAAEVGDDVALHVYEQLVSITLRVVCSGSWTPTLAVDGDPATLPQHTAAVIRQRGDDLGDRILCALHDAADAERTVVLGTDAPLVTPSMIDEAFAALDAADVVLGPATDGGYWLIGFSAVLPELFRDMPWSTDRVLDVTQERCAALGLRVATVATLSDIDTAADLRAWQ